MNMFTPQPPHDGGARPHHARDGAAPHGAARPQGQRPQGPHTPRPQGPNGPQGPQGPQGPNGPRPQGARPFRGSSMRSRPRRERKVRVEHAAPTSRERQRPVTQIPPIADNAVRIIPLGGVEEIGRNMTAIEVGNDIYVLDAGFQFKEDDTPGIDYILPNTGYLEERRHKVRGLSASYCARRGH